jgi:succinate dehydrogenase / fumarate reductase cytochrome b subunit|tara:strand:- start:309 stop:620 length:312 start_codon:yes stop_codon:yes gene_type:complete
MTGIGLWAGALLLTYIISAATYGPEEFYKAQGVLESWFGKLILFGLTLALYYHLANGLRHLAWDIGWGFELRRLKITGLLVLWFTVIMTVLTFLFGYWMAGAI